MPTPFRLTKVSVKKRKCIVQEILHRTKVPFTVKPEVESWFWLGAKKALMAGVGVFDSFQPPGDTSEAKDAWKEGFIATTRSRYALWQDETLYWIMET